MNPQQWAQVKEAFQAALELPAEQRSAYLDGFCTAEPALRGEVESLLRHYQEADGMLDTPADLGEALTAEEGPDPWLGQKIGPYQAVSKVGEGGMGAVYRAVRVDDHYLKHVAIKLVRSGFATGLYLRRFKNERQIMASLEHPNIARLLDGGATETGLPYLVMEYIEGQPIDEYCDTHRLNLQERLQLFVQVCSAVQYAHQNLIIHRDLKPGNILVTADGTPKLLDFGIAKLLAPELFFQTVDPGVTGQRAMTPEYASPEQVMGEAITTASDVYTLGVILYRLLTGHPPYHLRHLSPLEIARLISDSAPEKPSSVVLKSVEIPHGEGEVLRLTPDSVSSTREGRPALLRRRLAGDLDNIVLKAMRKDPARRYASAEQLAEDIRRYLDGMPVQARPDTFFYRSGKFILRHKTGMAAVAVILLTLMGGVALAARQAHLAEVQRARAEARFNDVRKLARKLLFDVHDSIQYLPGAMPARKVIVENALEYLDSLAKESSGDISIQRELATAYLKVGDVQGRDLRSNLGDTAGALASYRKALAIRSRLAEANPNSPEAMSDLAEGHDRLGEILSKVGDYEEALTHAQEAVDIRQRLAAAAPSDKDALLNLAVAYDGLGNVQADRGELDRSLVSARKSLPIFESLLQRDPQNKLYRRSVSLAHKKLGGIAEATGKLELALQEYQRSLHMDQQLVAENPNDGLYRRGLSISYSNIGDVLFKTGRYGEALRQYHQAVAIDDALSAADAQDDWARKYLVYNYLRLGDAQLKVQDAAGAQSTYEKCLRVAKARVTADASNAGALADLAEAYARLGTLHLSEGMKAELPAPARRRRLRSARSWYQASLKLWREIRDRGILRGVQARVPDQVAADLAQCEAALKDIGAPAS
ncbi:MAG: protein kinase [Acidobacteria bacterium]|nr:protein kinase [Acidobacteriota bacterium]